LLRTIAATASMSFGPRGVALSIERIKGAAPFIAQSVLAMRVKLSMATSILVIIVTSARQWPVLPPVSHTRGGDQGNLGNLGSLCGGHDRRCRFWSVLELLAHQRDHNATHQKHHAPALPLFARSEDHCVIEYIRQFA